MTGKTMAAMAASIALLTGCHAAGLVGAGPGAAANGAGATTGGAAARTGPKSAAARRHLLENPENCPCPIFLELTGSINSHPVDLVVDNFKVGTARLAHIRATYQPGGAVSGDFLFTNVNYEYLSPPQPHPNYPHGSIIQGSFFGTASGVVFGSGSPGEPFSLFDWPPPFIGAALLTPGVFTTNNVPIVLDAGFTRFPGSEALPVTDENALTYYVVKMTPPFGGVPEIQIHDAESSLTGENSVTGFLIESRCNGQQVP